MFDIRSALEKKNDQLLMTTGTRESQCGIMIGLGFTVDINPIGKAQMRECGIRCNYRTISTTDWMWNRVHCCFILRTRQSFRRGDRRIDLFAGRWIRSDDSCREIRWCERWQSSQLFAEGLIGNLLDFMDQVGIIRQRLNTFQRRGIAR